MSDLPNAQLYLGLGAQLGGGVAETGQNKWARCQGAVTLPWPRAHSILKWIGGDTFMLRQAVEMSRRNPRMTPAMAAGVTDRLWDVADLVALWEQYERRAERAA